MNVAVIGASGFIGSHTVEVLEALDGYVPVGYDRAESSRYAPNELDVTWPWQTIKSEFESANIEAVINYAGLLGTTELFDNVRSAIRVNIEGQYNVARAALELDIPLVTIEQPHIWTNPYETTRGAGVRLARSLAYHKGLRLATVTTYNAFGERQGYGGNHPQKFVPTFSVYADNGVALPIFGNGEQMVNAIYAKDIAKVFVDAINVASSAAPTFLGAAVDGNFTVNEFAQIVQQIAAPEAVGEVLRLPMRDGEDEGDGAAANYDSIVAQASWGVHVPQFRMRDLERTIEWYRGHKLDAVLP